MKVLFYRYGSICEPDIIDTFREMGLEVDEYRNETATLVESLNSFKESLTGSLASFINPILGGFEKLEGSLGLFSKGLVSVGALIVGKFILGKLKDGVMSIFGQAAKNFGKTVGDYLTQVQGRSLAKGADMKGLAPNVQKDRMTYGWGMNKNIAASSRRDEYNRGKFAKRGENLSSGEQIEIAMDAAKRIQSIKNYGSSLAKNSEEYRIYGQTYGAGIEQFYNDYGDLIKNIKDREEQVWSGNIAGSDYSKLNVDQKREYSQDMQKELAALGVNNAASLGLEKQKVGEIASTTNGPKEFLEKLIEFYKVSDDPKAAEYLNEATQALSDFNDQTIKSVASTEKLKELVKKSNEVANESLKGIKGRFSSLISGVITDIGTFAMKVKDSLSPKKLLAGLGKGLKFGALGLAGGIGVKFMASLSKNEKFQESMSSITEKIGTIFDGIVSSIEPVIEPVADAITGLFTIIQPALDWLSKVLGKIAGWFGGVLNKTVSSISTNVAKITDTYKEKDLRDMVKVTASYDAISDTLATKLDDVIYKIEGVHKRQDTQTELSMYAQQQQ